MDLESPGCFCAIYRAGSLAAFAFHLELAPMPCFPWNACFWLRQPGSSGSIPILSSFPREAAYPTLNEQPYPNCPRRTPWGTRHGADWRKIQVQAPEWPWYRHGVARLLFVTKVLMAACWGCCRQAALSLFSVYAYRHTYNVHAQKLKVNSWELSPPSTRGQTRDISSGASGRPSHQLTEGALRREDHRFRASLGYTAVK